MIEGCGVFVCRSVWIGTPGNEKIQKFLCDEGTMRNERERERERERVIVLVSFFFALRSQSFDYLMTRGIDGETKPNKKMRDRFSFLPDWTMIL